MQIQDLECMNISNLVSIPQTEAGLCPISVGSTQSGSPLIPWKIWGRLKDKGQLKPSPPKPEILCWVDDYPLYSIRYFLSYLALVLKIEKFKKKKKKAGGIETEQDLMRPSWAWKPFFFFFFFFWGGVGHSSGIWTESLSVSHFFFVEITPSNSC